MKCDEKCFTMWFTTSRKQNALHVWGVMSPDEESLVKLEIQIFDALVSCLLFFRIVKHCARSSDMLKSLWARSCIAQHRSRCVSSTIFRQTLTWDSAKVWDFFLLCAQNVTINCSISTGSQEAGPRVRVVELRWWGYENISRSLKKRKKGNEKVSSLFYCVIFFYQFDINDPPFFSNTRDFCRQVKEENETWARLFFSTFFANPRQRLI